MQSHIFVVQSQIEFGVAFRLFPICAGVTPTELIAEQGKLMDLVLSCATANTEMRQEMCVKHTAASCPLCAKHWGHCCLKHNIFETHLKNTDKLKKKKKEGKKRGMGDYPPQVNGFHCQGWVCMALVCRGRDVG